MTRYVVPIPAPAAGQDWAYTVPGIHLEDVVSVQAKLAVGSGTPTVMTDSGPSGLDGTYNPLGNATVTSGVPGIVPGDFAIDVSGGVSNDPGGRAPFTSAMFTGFDFTLVCWADMPLPATPVNLMVFDTTPHDPGSVRFSVSSTGPDLTMALAWGVVDGVDAVGTTDVYTPGPHMFSVELQASTGTVRFWLDDNVFGTIQTATSLSPNIMPDHVDIARSPLQTTRYDEFSWHIGFFGAGVFGPLYNDGITSFAAYNANIMSLFPVGYYHLDDVGVTGGRTPTFEITDGRNPVADIPDGFPAQATPGPYQYSWQAGLSSSTRTPNGQQTTVALPRLLLPAGYTVGTVTPDLAPGDQWSDITLWWDDTVQQLTVGLDDVHYPPGAYYVYQQVGAT